MQHLNRLFSCKPAWWLFLSSVLKILIIADEDTDSLQTDFDHDEDDTVDIWIKNLYQKHTLFWKEVCLASVDVLFRWCLLQNNYFLICMKVETFWMEQPINQSVTTLEGLGCDKRKRHFRAWLNGNTMFYETFVCFYVSEVKPLWKVFVHKCLMVLNDVEYTTFKMFVTQMSNYLFVISFQLMFCKTLRCSLARPINFDIYHSLWMPFL